MECVEFGARWYVMRDLKRSNAREPAYMMLEGKGMEVFVPMVSRLYTRRGRRVRVEVPFVRDLLFVRERRSVLDPVVDKTPTLQYRWLRRRWREPMTVRDQDMDRFVRAVRSSGSVRYYMPDELPPGTYGRMIRIIGGELDGYEGLLLTVRGSKTRRLLVELPGFFSAGVEVSPEYISFL